MDRLPIVIFALLAGAVVSCEERRDPPPERVNAVKAKAKAATTDGFCDFSPKTPTRFAYPKLATPPPASPAGTWRWINVWATWCKPCVEEMPRLQKWQSDLQRDGHKVQLVFVSIDESDDEVTAFRAKHKELTLTQAPRVAESKGLGDWYKSLGLDEGAPVPIHIWVDPDGFVRCARAGGVRDNDYASIEHVLNAK